MTRSNGFTLVELLVAMVAGSMLLAALGWTVATLGVQLGQAPGASQSADLDGARVLTALIERADVSSVAIGALVTRPDHLAMIVPAPQAAGDREKLRLGLRIERAPTGLALIAELTPMSGQGPSASALPPVTIASGLEQASFTYGPPSDPHEPSLPRFVTIEWRRAASDETAITIVPRINTEGGCRFDPISQACRP